jgi:hypothetical protein
LRSTCDLIPTQYIRSSEMSVNDTERENEREALPIDPPDNQGGGGASAAGIDSGENTDAAPIDPPDNQGGGGGS